MAPSDDLFAPAQNVVVLAAESKKTSSVRPAHHLNDSQTKFTNPWSSFRYPTAWQFTKYFAEIFRSPPPVPGNITSLIPAQKPTWGVGLKREDVKATWLGHACFLVEFPPAQDAVRGPRVIFDPVFQDKCSPSQMIGPKRLTPAPCEISEVPTVDAIVLSHNHYDHSDTPTIQKLVKQHNAQVFAPLGNLPYLSSIGIPPSHIHILDWWDHRTLSLSIPTTTIDESNPSIVESTLKITCTPAQHTSNRSLLDRWRTLWASWAVQDITTGKGVYFAGDTGYRTIGAGEDPDRVPVCPAFKEIGDKLGPFELAMLPIGAYDPRSLFSNVHAHPADSVRIFKDVKARKALAMHWGTWILTTEPVMEPPAELRRECEKANVMQEEFDICGLGETRPF